MNSFELQYLGVCQSSFFIFPGQTGTATSSPDVLTPSPTIINVMLWMKKEAYADSTIKATAKRLKHLKKNCLLADPESVKILVANKKCSNAFKECLIETYDIFMRSIGKNGTSHSTRDMINFHEFQAKRKLTC